MRRNCICFHVLFLFFEHRSDSLFEPSALCGPCGTVWKGWSPPRRRTTFTGRVHEHRFVFHRFRLIIKSIFALSRRVPSRSYYVYWFRAHDRVSVDLRARFACYFKPTSITAIRLPSNGRSQPINVHVPSVCTAYIARKTVAPDGPEDIEKQPRGG
jgi:hypothetical protein